MPTGPEDVSRWKQFEHFYKDVTFTSDDQYFLTEWEGKPTLFNLSSLQSELTPIKQFDTPTYMTACTFSPDDEFVYIACEDNKIYVFESGIPDTKVDDWQLH